MRERGDGTNMKWQAAYSVHNELLDAQHQGLFAVIEELGLGLTSGGDADVVAAALAKLTRYADQHFEMEEAMMAQADFPGVEDHRQEHQRLVQALRDFVARFDAEDPTVRDELYFFLISDWLASHILGHDHAYVADMEREFGATQ
jgi:hemerythrin